jgi:hypothetical protein
MFISPALSKSSLKPAAGRASLPLRFDRRRTPTPFRSPSALEAKTHADCRQRRKRLDPIEAAAPASWDSETGVQVMVDAG